MKTDVQAIISNLHNWYIKETGLTIPLCDDCTRGWYEWRKWSEKHCGESWTEQDLLKVFYYLRKNHDRIWFLRMVGFKTLIWRPEEFSQHLAQARAATKPHTPRQRVLAQSGRPQKHKGSDIRSAGDVINDADLKSRGSRLADLMRQAVESGS